MEKDETVGGGDGDKNKIAPKEGDDDFWLKFNDSSFLAQQEDQVENSLNYGTLGDLSCSLLNCGDLVHDDGTLDESVCIVFIIISCIRRKMY
jgi:hypothetical protein